MRVNAGAADGMGTCEALYALQKSSLCADELQEVERHGFPRRPFPRSVKALLLRLDGGQFLLGLLGTGVRLLLLGHLRLFELRQLLLGGLALLGKVLPLTRLGFPIGARLLLALRLRLGLRLLDLFVCHVTNSSLPLRA